MRAGGRTEPASQRVLDRASVTSRDGRTRRDPGHCWRPSLRLAALASCGYGELRSSPRVVGFRTSLGSGPPRPGPASRAIGANAMQRRRFWESPRALATAFLTLSALSSLAATPAPAACGHLPGHPSELPLGAARIDLPRPIGLEDSTPRRNPLPTPAPACRDGRCSGIPASVPGTTQIVPPGFEPCGLPASPLDARDRPRERSPGDHSDRASRRSSAPPERPPRTKTSPFG